MARQSKQHVEQQPKQSKNQEDFFHVFAKDGVKGYTYPGYVVKPGEGDGVHIEAEIRRFDEGHLVSSPVILKFGDRAFLEWYKNRPATGFSINHVLHRPPSIDNFEVDEWKGGTPESRIEPTI